MTTSRSARPAASGSCPAGSRPTAWPRPTGRRSARRSATPWPRFRSPAGSSPRPWPASRRYRLAAAGLTSESDTLLKALMWQGDVCFGPARDGHATLRRLDAVPGWAGLPDVDEAGRRAVTAYFRTYGPATPDHLRHWLGEGLSAGRKAIRGWLDDLGDRLVSLDVDGETTLVLQCGRRRDLRGLAQLGRPPPAGPRPVGDGSGHRRSSRRPAGPAGGRLARRPPRRRRRRGLGDLVGQGERRGRRLVPRGDTRRARATSSAEVDRLATVLGRTLEMTETPVER